jgi:hypothetical protein
MAALSGCSLDGDCFRQRYAAQESIKPELRVVTFARFIPMA